MSVPVPHARTVATASLRRTLMRALESAHSCSELEFRDMWLQDMAGQRDILADGWYDPPPHGIAVIADTPQSPDRISFSSLRSQSSWPTSRRIDWRSDILYCYCSPVSLRDGLPGDSAATFYFGTDALITRHIDQTRRGLDEILALPFGGMTSQDLYHESCCIFERLSLRNAVVSVTDSMPNDLGHTMPVVPSSTGFGRYRDYVRGHRQFIDAQSVWSLDGCGWLSIEPQLVSVENQALPQIAYHVLVHVDSEIRILRDSLDLARSVLDRARSIF